MQSLHCEYILEITDEPLVAHITLPDVYFTVDWIVPDRPIVTELTYAMIGRCELTFHRGAENRRFVKLAYDEPTTTIVRHQ